MTTASTPSSALPPWGWRLLILVGVLMALDGVWLFSAGGSGDVFASDTGVAMAEVQQAYPAVVEVMNRRGRLLGLLVAGLGVVTLVAGAGRRTVDGRNAALVVAVTSLAVSAYVFVAGNVEVGLVYVALGALAAVGVALARPKPAS